MKLDSRKDTVIRQQPAPELLEIFLVRRRGLRSSTMPLGLLVSSTMFLSHEPDSFLTEASSVGTVPESGSFRISPNSLKPQMFHKIILHGVALTGLGSPGHQPRKVPCEFSMSFRRWAIAEPANNSKCWRWGLHRQGEQIEVCQFAAALGRDAGAGWNRAGIVVHSLGWTRRIDPVPLWRLHGILSRARPDIVHAWGRTALRALALVGRKLLDRVVLSQPFVWDQRQPTSALDRWLFRKVARIIVQGEAEASSGQISGLVSGKDRRGAARASPSRSTPALHRGRRRRTGVPGRARLCASVRWKGTRDFAMPCGRSIFCGSIFEDLHLVFVGDGPDETHLRQMARNLRRDDATHFLQPCRDAAACLAQADVCWVPSVRGGGTQATLEAMLAGRAVIACQVPSLDGLIVDGQSGFCIPPDDKVAWLAALVKFCWTPAWPGSSAVRLASASCSISRPGLRRTLSSDLSGSRRLKFWMPS